MTESTAADEKLMRPDLWVLVFLGIAGLVFFFLRYQDSFPSASIDLKLSRTQATEMARAWCPTLGYDANGAVSSTVFNYDDDAKTFLEYELGQAQANTLMRDQVPVWSWQSRFCRPFQIEEMSVGIGPDGSLHWLTHSLPNDAPGKTLSHEDAQKIARDFVEKQLGQSLAGTTLVKDSQDKQVQRMDHYFIWEDQTHDYKGGKLRTYVYVAGDRVTEYSKQLHVPEKFDRKYADIRSYNDLLKQISSIVYLALSSAISFIFVWAFASGRIRWKFCLFAAAIGALLSLLNWVDGFPALTSAYQTTMSFQQYMTQSAVQAGLSAFYAVVACLVFIAALEPIYRMAFPEKLALEKLPTADGLRSKSMFRSLVAGLAVFGMHTAYVVAFYLAGQKLGFWSPLEVRESSTLSGLWPFFSAIDVGVSASTMEELMYRVLAMAIFRRILDLWIFRSIPGKFWIANLLQAASWAFMHSDYPQEPAYARGVELTIGGFFYGYILRRYGLPACILAHYTYDAFLGVTPLFSAHSVAERLSAIVPILPGVIALAISGWLIARRGATPDESRLSNAAISPPPKETVAEPVEEPAPFDYQPLRKSAIMLVVIGGLIGLILQFAVPLRTIGDLDRVTIPREQAGAIARAYLLQKGVNLDGMQATTAMIDETDETEMQYVFEKAGFAKTKQLNKAMEPRMVWKVRFFKPMDPEQFYVILSPDGKVYSQSVVEEEDAPGAKLTEAEARAKVEDFLNTVHPELKPYVFQDSTKHERKARIDYDFTYTVPSLKVGEADLRVYVSTIGNMVSGFGPAWQVPDAWKFERQKVQLKDQAFDIMRKALGVLLALLAIWWFITVVRPRRRVEGLITWRIPAALAGVSALLLLLRQINLNATLFWSYQTEVPMNNFLIGAFVNDLMMVLSGAAATGLGTAVALAAFKVHFPEKSVRSLLTAALPHMGRVSATTRRMWLDACILGVWFNLLANGLDHIIDVGLYLTSPTVRMLQLGTIRTLTDEWSPAVGTILSTIPSGITMLVAAAILATVVRVFFNRQWKFFAAVVVIELVMNSYLRYWQDYLWTVLWYMLLSVIIYVYAVRLARFNLLAYLMPAYLSALAGTAYTLVRHEAFPLYFPQLALLVLAMAAPLVYTAWLYVAPQLELEIVPPDKVA